MTDDELKIAAARRSALALIEDAIEAGDMAIEDGLPFSEHGEALFAFGQRTNWPAAETFYRQACEEMRVRPKNWPDVDPRMRAAFAAFAGVGKAIDTVSLSRPDAPAEKRRPKRTEPNAFEERVDGIHDQDKDMMIPKRRFSLGLGGKKPRGPAKKKTGGKKKTR